MASKALVFMLGIFLLLLAIQLQNLQVDALRMVPHQPQLLQEAMPSTLQGAEENVEKYTKPEFGLMSKRLAQKDGDCDWQQAAAALGHLISKSQNGCGGTTPAKLGTRAHTTVTADTLTTTKKT